LEPGAVTVATDPSIGAELHRLSGRLLAAVSIATKCGYAISAHELLQLLPSDPGLDEERVIAIASNDLHSAVSMRADLVVLKGFEFLFDERDRRRIASGRAMELAREFVLRLAASSPGIALAAVSGSVAYKSSRDLDDIDIFLVAHPGRLWLSLFRALLLSRAYNLKGRVLGRQINFCICYAVDTDCCERELSRRRTPLIAREILTIQPIVGDDFYRLLITKNDWVKAFFPRLYALRLSEPAPKPAGERQASPAAGLDAFADRFTFVLLSLYLLLKATLRNLKFRREGRSEDIFSVAISSGACIYSSIKYRVLEEMHSSMVM